MLLLLVVRGLLAGSSSEPMISASSGGCSGPKKRGRHRSRGDEDALAHAASEHVEGDQLRALVGAHLEQGPLGSASSRRVAHTEPVTVALSISAPVRSRSPGRAPSRAPGASTPRPAPSTSRAPAAAASSTVRSVTAPRSMRRDRAGGSPAPGARARTAAGPRGSPRRRSRPGEQRADEPIEVLVGAERHVLDAAAVRSRLADDLAAARRPIPRRRPQHGGHRRRGTLGTTPFPLRPASASASSSRSICARVLALAHPTASSAAVAASDAARTSASSPVRYTRPVAPIIR